MRIRCLTLFILCFLATISSTMYAQSYDQLWIQVEEAREKDLPRTVTDLTKQIFVKAQKEKDSAQMLKAYLTRMHYQRTITPDSFYVDLQGLELWAQESTVALDRMILHTILAELYADFAETKPYNWAVSSDKFIDQVPGDDLQTWDAYRVSETIIAHTQKAFEDTELLLNTSSEPYLPLVAQGESSMVYHHDMYHLLALHNLNAMNRMVNALRNDQQSIQRVRIAELLDQMIKIYQSRNNREGVLLARLLRLEKQGYAEAEYSITIGEHQNRLRQLIEEYKDSPWGVEAWIALTDYNRRHVGIKEMLQIAREAIAAYPQHPRTNLIRQWVAEATQPQLRINLPSVSYPGAELLLKIDYQNLQDITMEFYSIPKVDLMKLRTSSNELTQEELKSYIKKKTPEKQTIHLEHFTEYQLNSDTIRLKTPDVGLYAIRFSHPDITGEPPLNLLCVSNLRIVTQRLPNYDLEVVVLNAHTGRPVADSDVVVYGRDSEHEDYNQRKQMATFRTDSIGRAAFEWEHEYDWITAEKGKDRFLPLQEVGWIGYNSNNSSPVLLENNSYHRLSLLTDRSLYRPGQTIFVKGIFYAHLSDTAQVLSGREQEISLQSYDRQWEDKQTVVTNEYGSFGTEFVLPASLAPGGYQIYSRYGSTSIQVEEYKRPTFSLFFDTPKGSYKMGDKLKITGTARTFSGVGLSGSPIKYTITRTPVQNWWYYPGSGMVRGQIISSGEVNADKQGRFSIPVHLEDVTSNQQRDVENYYFLYEIKATYTSPSGETQEVSTTIRVGKRSLMLTADLPDNIEKEKPLPVQIESSNLSEIPIVVTGTYRLYPRLANLPADRNQPERDYEVDPYRMITPPEVRSQYATKAVFSGKFTTNQESILGGWNNLPSGKYLMIFAANDPEGREVTLEKEVLLFSASEQRPPVSMPFWYVPLQTEFGPSETASFLLGTSEKDACVILDVFSGDKRLEIRHIHLSDTVMRFEYPYLESYGNGVTLSFMMLHNEQFYEQQVSLTKRMQPKELTLHWETFRDKLRPGQEETWKLTVRDPKGKPVDAELLALMYDASLDEIRPYDQQLRPNYWISSPSFNRNPLRYYDLYFGFRFPVKRFAPPNLVFDGLMQPRISLLFSSDSGLLNTSDFLRPRAKSVPDSPKDDQVDKGMVTFETGSARFRNEVLEVQGLSSMRLAADDSGSGNSGSLRTNFNETAFFYPQLHTNSQGEITFTFTLPESLTTWNFRGFAHTKDMFTGMLSGSTIASKEFMVMTNLPRFVRTGDETAFAATLTNQTDKPQKGSVTFTLFDPATDKVIHHQKRSFSVKAKENIGVDFRFTASSDYELLGCRIVAETGSFSDGEQHLLPVLPNREQVTEAVPLLVRGGETKQFALDHLFNDHSKTVSDQRLTVEFSGNPAWYAVQALPGLSNPQEEDANSLVSAWYANSIASHILTTYPQMQQIIEGWRLSGKESFTSHLQQNEELKNIILAESPWLLDAHNEKEQMERLALLFDPNQLRYNNQQLVNRLRQLQNYNGSWFWYAGMNPNNYTSLNIMEAFIRQQLLTHKEPEPEVAQMLRDGWNYLHEEAMRQYNQSQLKVMQASGDLLTPFMMQYLYLIALSGEQVPSNNRSAYQKLIDLIPAQITRQNMSTKARSAIILYQAGRTKEARDFTNSLNEYLVRTDDQGAHFAFNQYRASWWGQPIPAHVITMEAIDKVTGDTALLEEMKIWLLNQKQTRQWRTPVATVNAVYALLYRGENPLDRAGDVEIRIGKHTLQTTPTESRPLEPVAYIKETYTDESEINHMKEAIVEKRDSGFAWGAVYAQYQEDISKISRAGEELQIEKTWFIERYENNVHQLITVSDKNPIRVGDKVVCQLTLRVDRPMDFVQLSDQRAACFEPVENLSGYRGGWSELFAVSVRDSHQQYLDTPYFMSVRDASTRFFFETLSKGIYVIEHSYLVNRAGEYESGITTLQSAYAPEYAAHAPSIRIKVK